MRPTATIRETIKDNTGNAPANAQETRRRRRSGILVALLVFAVAYLLFVVRFEHWGLALGWMPSTVIAAAFGWFGYCFPWIGDAIVILWDVLCLLSVFS